MKRLSKKNIIKLGIAAVILSVATSLAHSKHLSDIMLENYYAARSAAISDRAGETLFIRPNAQGYYAQYLKTVPVRVRELLVAKEDRAFYWHTGVDPLAIAKNIAAKFGIGNRSGASTVTQQLAKNLLGNVNDRRLSNKVKEVFAAFALEIDQSKEDILTEYSNTIYFGNRLQGLQTAAIAYFGVAPDKLTDAQIFQLLATINNPNNLNPARNGNINKARILAKNMKKNIKGEFTPPEQVTANLKNYFAANTPILELAAYINNQNCSGDQQTTIDNGINQKIRQIIAKDLEDLGTKKAKNAAAIIINLPQNQVLAMSGSPDPDAVRNGYQINMLNVKRQVGSTIKPFIYLKAFEKGMRPYTLIDDREYKYPASNGYSIYPENYDRDYRGLITAHYSLANSINVSAVKTLEFVGNRQFGNFIQNELEIPVQQDYDNYQMGIALGVMETDIVSLARAFTIFPNNGNIKNLQLFQEPQCNASFSAPKNASAANKPYVELVNKILSDRTIAQDQFSSASDLNLPANNYALKTGTSHDYTDSWIIGYTPDFLVAVWVGNADASAMEGISGQLGAGRIWNNIMEMMLASEYNKKTPFDFSDIVEFRETGNIEYGLSSDDYENSKNILIQNDNKLIIKPHDGDTYRLEPNSRIILRSSRNVTWYANNKKIGSGNEIIYTPQNTGLCQITAINGSQSESITVNFVK